MRIVQRLYAAGVVRVFVAEIVERGIFPSWTCLSRGRFNTIRRFVNRKLCRQFGNDFVLVGKRLRFPQHYDSDLIHPGVSEGGMKILMFAVLHAFRKQL